eukprot:gene20052-26769_t
MASPNVPGVAEVQLRMNKKIAELTKIIYNLNNRVDDPEVDLQDVADEYGAEMEQILRDTAASVSTFNGYMGMPRDEGKAKDIQKLEATLEAERLKWQKELETVRQIRAVELNSQGPQLIQELSQTQAHLSDAQHDLSQARKELSEKDRQIQLLQQEMSALKSK